MPPESFLSNFLGACNMVTILEFGHIRDLGCSGLCGYIYVKRKPTAM